MLIVNGTIATFGDRPQLIRGGAIRVKDGVIEDMGSQEHLVGIYGEDEKLDAQGKMIMPGFICGHGHFYGAFARGMPLGDGVEPPSNFVEVLERLWWRVDRALHLNDVYWSSKLCMAEAIKCGTTTIIDHHASPNAIAGSLDTIAKAVSEAGVRTSLCYEVTDRNGEEGAIAGIKENVGFARNCNHYKFIKGAMGLHASLTLSDETLVKAREAAEPLCLPYHIHVAEDKADVFDSIKKSGKPVIERLHTAGILGDRTYAIHCIHIDEKEMGMMAEAHAMVSHCPESNMNNGVGVANIPDMLGHGIRVGLGTDGFTYNMLREMKAAYLVHKLRAGDPRAMPAEDVVRLAYANNAAIARRMLDARVGVIEKGAAADIILMNYRPPTPINAENFPYHMLFGMSSQCVDTVMVGGEVLMHEQALLHIDEAELADKASEHAKGVWERLP
jgi:putative selenium metabolism protein SsnA